ncbi:taste receptor cell protein 1 isoform X2 [Orcinus orca]|uniref:taste receptor cell protein 1 isoform X2 n=1 Tax=Orcinus orca TaxID=9733 RepID=UPI002112C2B2|nr:taste receptor cell protein 1 isoform X2 [Orcinus orca]
MGVRSSLWPGCDFLASNAQALTFLSCLPHSCSPTAEDSGSPSPGPSRVTHSVTFTITNEAFSAALGNPASLEYQLLSENIRHQLQSVCHEAFSSFEGVGVLLFSPRTAQQKTGPQGKDEGNLDPEAARFQISPHKPLQPHAQARLPPQDMASWSTSYRLSEIPQACHLPLSRSPAPVMPPKMFFSVWLRPDSAAVNASLVFGGLTPGPSAREVLWTLYRKVKAAGKLLGTLSLDESSLASDGSDLTDLALETTSNHLMAMRPFQPPLLLPGSARFVLLEKTILRQVTPVLSGFYTARPQEEPLLLFSNADQWAGVYIEYKFQTPIGTHLPGLANHLARNIMDPTVQKSSIMANADHRPQASAELRPSGGEVPVRPWWLWVAWGPGLNSSGGASGSEKRPS